MSELVLDAVTVSRGAGPVISDVSLRVAGGDARDKQFSDLHLGRNRLKIANRDRVASRACPD